MDKQDNASPVDQQNNSNTDIPMEGSNPPPAMQTVDTSNVPKDRKIKKKLIIIVISVLVGLIIIGGVGVFAALRHLNNKPEKVLADALTNSAADLLERSPMTSVSKIVYSSNEEDIKVAINIQTKTDEKIVSLFPYFILKAKS